MKTNHTPGPWTYAGACEPIERKAGESVEQIWCGSLVVAEVMTTEEPGIGVSEGWENARLIAAAPELLAALQNLLAHSSNVNTAFYGIGKPKAVKAAMEGQRELLQAAREAIAKATQYQTAKTDQTTFI